MRFFLRNLLVGWLSWTPFASTQAADSALVERFDFGTEEFGPLIPRGDIVRDQAGPRPPEFPTMEADNSAVQLKGNGARFEIKDPGPQSRYDFTNGDAITLEAWIKVESLRAGQPAYIIGKGRTLSPRFGKDNQNWSLRVVGAADGQAALSFHLCRRRCRLPCQSPRRRPPRADHRPGDADQRAV